MFDKFFKIVDDLEANLPGFRYVVAVFVILVALGYLVLTYIGKDNLLLIIPGFFFILLAVLFIWLILSIVSPPSTDDATLKWMRKFLTIFVLFLFVGFTLTAITLAVTLTLYHVPERICREFPNNCVIPPAPPGDHDVQLAHAILKNQISRDWPAGDQTEFDSAYVMDKFLRQYGCGYCKLNNYAGLCAPDYTAQLCLASASVVRAAQTTAPRFLARRHNFHSGSGCAATQLAHAGTPAHIFGIDLSHTDADVDFASLPARGIYFVYLKASQGTGFVDPAFVRRWIAAGKAGLIRGAYHTLTSDDPKAQAALFLSAVAQVNSGSCDLGPALDMGIAQSFANAPGGNLTSFAAKAVQWLGTVKGALAAAAPGGVAAMPIVYVSAGTFPAAGTGTPALAGYPLWFGSYAVIGNPSVPLPWTGFVFRQFTDGHSGQVLDGLPYDASEFVGTPGELFALTR